MCYKGKNSSAVDHRKKYDLYYLDYKSNHISELNFRRDSNDGSNELLFYSLKHTLEIWLNLYGHR